MSLFVLLLAIGAATAARVKVTAVKKAGGRALKSLDEPRFVCWAPGLWGVTTIRSGCAAKKRATDLNVVFC